MRKSGKFKSKIKVKLWDITAIAQHDEQSGCIFSYFTLRIFSGLMPLLLPPVATSTQSDSPDYPVALIRYSRQIEAAKALKAAELLQDRGEYYGAQLSPWRDRDMIALAEVFDGEDLAAINHDIEQALQVLWPEPCWEDEVFWQEWEWQGEAGDREFEFLAEFL